jgi:ParB-like chromosome segregation protein Spo0J
MAAKKPSRAKGQAQIEKKFSNLQTLKIEYAKVGSVSPNSYNPNRQSSHDFELLIRSMTDDGFTQPIIVQEGTGQIVDGEHRWTAAIVLEGLKRRGLEATAANISALRQTRLDVLREIADHEIPVVYTNMTEEQRRIATLRHNRARGSEDFELTSKMFADLQQLGAIDIAQEALMLDDAEMSLLMDSIPAPDALAGDEYGEAWEPSQSAEAPGASADGRSQTDMTPAAIEATRIQEQKVRDAHTEQDKAAARQEAAIYRLSVVFAGTEADIVKKVLGSEPAKRILEICKELQHEESGE